VACSAGGGESRSDVVGIGGGVVLSFVARVAVGRRTCVDVIDVALGAGYSNVCAGKRECRFVVVEDSIGPRAGVVANGAGCGESSRDVIWVGGGGVLRLMAGVAIGGSARESVVGVALRAGNVDMHSSERIAGVGGVVELRSEPACRAVAHRAIVGQAGGNVRRVIGRDKILLMARIAGGWGALEPVVEMAGDAVQGGVHAGEREAGHLEMIEFGPEPVVHGEAALASGGETGRDVIDYGGFEVLLMAGVAGG